MTYGIIALPTLTITHQDAWLVTLTFPDAEGIHYAASSEERGIRVAEAWADHLDLTIHGWDAGTALLGPHDASLCRDCGGLIPTNSAPGAYPGAMSRRDGVEICSACGVREALTDMEAAAARRYLYDA